jgi:hypothetical protein
MARTITRVTLSGMLLLLGVLTGCGGSGTNNDQGTSFMAMGYFQDSSGDVGDGGAIVPMFRDIGTPFGPNGERYDIQQHITWMGLLNRLERQFVRVVRIDCSYKVEGSFLNVPNDSFGLSVVLAPTSDEEPGAGILPNISYSPFQILSPDIYSFLNNNQALLPQLPYRMVATCSATGVTQSGTTMTTNPLNYFVNFVDESECCTGGEAEGVPGFQAGPGTGGTLLTTDR